MKKKITEKGREIKRVNWRRWKDRCEKTKKEVLTSTLIEISESFSSRERKRMYFVCE